MKKLILTFALVFTAFFAYSQPTWTNVGQLVNGVPQLTFNKANLISTFSAKLLQLSNINGNFSDVEIIVLPDTTYALRFIGPVYKSTLYIQAVGNSLNVLSNVSCTTSDCSSEPLGCVVKWHQGEIGYCTPCGNLGVCTKTSSGTAFF